MRNDEMKKGCSDIKEEINKCNLKSSGHVKKSLGALERIGLVYNKRIDDFFFREWIKKYKTYHTYLSSVFFNYNGATSSFSQLGHITIL